MYRNTALGNSLLGLALALVLIAGTATVALPANAGGWFGQRGNRASSGYGKLDLSDAQRAQIKQIRRSHRAESQAARRTLRQQHETFWAMSPDAAGYQAAAASFAQAEGQATQRRIQRGAEIRTQIYAVLTPAQRAKLAARRMHMQARRAEWRQFKAQHPASSAG